MNPKVKNGLFLLFIFLFIIITALAWLSASGYKLNLDKPIKWGRVLQKTGMLNLATLPKGAYIYLDNKPQKKTNFSLFKKDYLTTPIKIKNLLPGDYLLRLEKENYWPLEKRIKIEPGQTTFAEDINLFKNDSPFLISESAPGKLLISPNNYYLYLEARGEIYNIRDNLFLNTQLEAGSNGSWMKNNYFFTNGQIVQTDKDNLLDLTTIIGAGATNWRYNNFDEKIYFINQNEISHFDSEYKTINSLIKGEKYLDYIVLGSDIFVITDNNKIYLKKYSLKNLDFLGEIELPSFGKYNFIGQSAQFLELYDKTNKTLYLINVNNLSEIDLINNVQSWSWLNEEELLFTNGWEINIFNLISGQASLVTRVGENINSILYHKKGRYFIFTTNNNINVGDFKDGSFIKILSAENIFEPVLDEKNDLLFFNATIDNITGAYKLLLQ